MPEMLERIAAQPTLSNRDVTDAQRALAGAVIRTPVIRCAYLDRFAGARLWLKAENLQHGGSFKLRGALLAVTRLAAAGSNGIVAQSTGNHAISVALAARQHRLPAVLVLPGDAALAKITSIREAGAEVILAGTMLAERMAVVDELSTARELDIVDPYQDPDVVRGQGTATAEMIDQVSAAGGRLDAVVLPVGGGSAVAGACLATEDRGIDVFGAEPSAVPALSQALAAGHPVSVPVRPTIADGLRPERIGDLPFGICQKRLKSVVTVEEPAIADALRLLLVHAKVVVEPAASTALAAAFEIASGSGGDIGVLLSGGNVEPALIASLLSENKAV
jgi:threo-3-hydroxy-L-aspartate ammonia-lyase